MSNPGITMQSLTFATEDLIFICEQLAARAKFCEYLALNLDKKYRASERREFKDMAAKCNELIMAIKLAGNL